ncbi:MAG TPA: S41 family peptidase [Chitinophagaceae bacterium]
MQLKNKKYLLILAMAMSIFASCQKGIKDTSPTPIVSADDNVKDSVLLVTKELYLWYSQIPSTFNPGSYADPSAIMTAIRQYSIEPGFTGSVDRWSFAMRQADYNNLSNGISGDFGIGAGFVSSTDLRVSSVQKASPAGLASIHRGWQIIKVNGSTSITTSSTDIDFLNNAIFNSQSTAFTFRKPDGSTVDITLNVASYQEHPVFIDTVYSISSKKIGYMGFSSFLGDTTEISNEFNRVFNRFSAAGVNDVIIDLRYNGGGYVSIAQQLSNYLAPSSANGQLMMSQKYNDKYSQYNTSANFVKAGSLNLTRIFFIVGAGTASASELTINNLKPYMDVELVGQTTHGKPVAFFPYPVGDWYIFPVSIRSTNKNGDGNYFNGFTPNSQVSDGITKDWGDITETSLASAIKYITTGSYRLQADQIYVEQPEVKSSNIILNEHNFKGTIIKNKIFK